MIVVVRNIRLPLSAPEGEIMEQAVRRLAPFVDKKDICSCQIFRRSVDTRHGTVSLVFSVAVTVSADLSDEVLTRADSVRLMEIDPTEGLLPGEEAAAGRPVIVGFGPCGMFAALMLAEAGYRPIVIERGDNVLTRTQRVGVFLRTGELDTDSNIQFGAGGAGTFSDGKLVTRINDARSHYVLRRLVEYGAPREILTQAKPHIGTDKLLGVVAAIDRRIRASGGEIFYRTKMTALRVINGRVAAVVTDAGDIPCGQVILAIGHSARDTYALLSESGFLLEPKPFSVGVRIEHRQADIDRAVYKREAGHPKLGPAEYALSKRIGEDAVYTFCMCPGGEVVAAASETGGVVTNGMSRYRRDGVNANAALVVSVVPKDDPVGFQRRLEAAAFVAGGSDYAAPIQTVGDFLTGSRGTEPGRVQPSYRKGKVRTADLAALFPPRITQMLRLGLLDFERKLRGFSVPDAILTGVETRTSAPYRIRRSDALTAIGYDNIYPCGEGAGYAGGITSAAVDGLRIAEALIRRFTPYREE